MWATAAAAAKRKQWEELLAWQIKARGLPTPEREYRFDSVRGWRFDFAWRPFMVAAEVEGVTHDGGRHQRMAGFEADCEKYNAAAEAGWCLLRFSQAKVKSGYAVRAIERMLEKRRLP